MGAPAHWEWKRSTLVRSLLGRGRSQGKKAQKNPRVAPGKEVILL
jgi:hypothetical protein